MFRRRAMVDVSTVDASVTLFGRLWPSPIALAPVALQHVAHPDLLL